MPPSKIITGAHYGIFDWLVQRITAIWMVLYTLVIGSMAWLGEGSHQAWRELMATGWVQSATILFVLCLCWHAWVGVRDIWMDYIKCSALRLLLHVVTLGTLFLCVAWAVQILWEIA